MIGAAVLSRIADAVERARQGAATLSSVRQLDETFSQEVTRVASSVS